MCGAMLARGLVGPLRAVRGYSTAATVSLQPDEELATFAAGCFWGVQLHFQRQNGVVDSQVGYINGITLNPSYTQVCTGNTGHAEAVQLKFNRAIVSYEELLEKFWSIHDPTTLNQQKNDIGTQYRSGIYYHNDQQLALATASKQQAQSRFARPIVTEIVPAQTFYLAEDYHQRYLEKGGQCARTGSTVPIRCYDTLLPNEQLATFAAGCFWSVQLNFQRLDGVVNSHVGYTSGTTVNPSYKEVCTGNTGHAEAVQIKYDESKISYKELLDKFFEIHDPTLLNRQKEDVGTQYRSGIYYHNEEQRELAEEAKKQKAEELKTEVVTEILPASTFYHAEDYHQKYLEKGGQCARVGSKNAIRCYG
ncbi:hypothetical protein THRCLA_10095 [Thraustotheca clavata]|uniref:peptide-methionine (S)-S-oxide reductase n=1 Tax=Thraustotheca clavata TaxID=74557 RepID=A0A1V9YT65_9STRA|nr:hypothetical protein THRCLA_10095 [Thraustotheca clavata]